MKRVFNIKSLIFCLAIMTAACSSHRYTVEKADFRRYTIDSSYDNLPNAEAEKFIAPYRQTVDSIMSPIVGYAAYAMEAGRPESLLSNFLTDILVAAGGDFNEKPDLGIYNIGGIRASISKGPIRAGDIIDVAPFENKLCFLTLSGKDLISLFEQIAARGGEGVSSQVRAVISKDGRLRSLSIKGEPVREEATYRIATIDYLAKSVNPTGDASYINLPSVAAAVEGYAKSYESIVIPVSDLKNIKIAIDGHDYIYTHDTAIQLQGGKTTIVNLMVGRNEITLGSMSIKGWEELVVIGDDKPVEVTD